ncbi:MAG: PaaI family thioesterase [Oligoflexus sp.]
MSSLKLPLKDWQETELPFAKMVESFVSGPSNQERLNIRYYKTTEPDLLFGRIIFGKGAEGPPGHAHGGAQAAVIDEICGGALWVWGHQVVAAKLETEFIKMVPLGQELILEGRLTHRNGRKLETEGFIKNLDQEVLAKGKVLFIELSSEKFQFLHDTKEKK